MSAGKSYTMGGMSRKQPTLKQTRFAHNFLVSGNVTQSALKAYDTENRDVAYQIGYRNLKSPAVRNFMEQILTKAGLDDATLSKNLQKIIKAGTSERSLKRATPSDSLRGIEMAFKLLDRFPAERKRIERRDYRVQLEAKSPEELKKMLDRLLKETEEWKRKLAGE